MKADAFIRSPELKPQESFSDQNISVSVVDVVVVVVVVNSSSPEPLGQFHPNLIQSINGWRDSNFFKRRTRPFSKGRYLRNSEHILTKFKYLLLQKTWSISTNFLRWWEFKYDQKNGHALFQGIDWLIAVGFFAKSAIFQPCNGRDYCVNDRLWNFGVFLATHT